MPNSQSTINNLQSEQGFTLPELLVVVAIMAILATVLVLNLAGQRAKRDVQIAENQLVSNIRQIQGSTLSGRSLPSGQYVQYYVMKFDLSKPQQYTIQAIYGVSDSAPMLVDVQTVVLPPDVQIATITPGSYPISIVRPNNPTTLNLPDQNYGNCALLAFVAPFGKVLMDSGSCSIASPPAISSPDDYYYLINFVFNNSCQSNNNPVGCNVSTDSTLNIVLTDTGKTYSKTVTVYGITGAVSFN